MASKDNPVLALTAELIRRRSITPQDAGCQRLIGERLGTAGFEVEHLRHGDVDNLWACHGEQEPLLCFLGHTDVVPTGPEGDWSSPPFEPQVRDGLLYGRGAADMKSGVAAMTVALERFVAEHPDHRGSIALLLTSDEEGPAVDGTRRVVEALAGRGERIDWCIVGEPSSEATVADTLKNGRRGSLTARLTVFGKQGHVAYPQLADNPLHRLAPVLAELCATEWDQGNEHFPPTSLQVSNLNAGTGADNVIPGKAEVVFNLRYTGISTVEELQRRVTTLLDAGGLDYEIDWHNSGEPFLTDRGELLEAAQEAVADITGQRPRISTAGGTSDGRFVAPAGAEVVEVGVVNASIHQVDEHVRVRDLIPLADIYRRCMQRLLG